MDLYLKQYENKEIKAHEINALSDFEKYVQKPQDKFKILHMNIRSIQKNYDEFLLFLSHLPDFDVIVLTETHILNEISIFNIDGYDLIYNNGTYNKNDGVILYVKHGFKHSHSIIKLSEINAIELKIKYNKEPITITALYKSPNLCPKTFNKNLNTYLNNNKKENFHIITGDINIDLLSNIDYVEQYKNTLHTFGFVSYINQITRPKSKTCLDHFFMKNSRKSDIPNEEIHSFIFNSEITDHIPISLVVNNRNYSNENKNKEQYKKFTNYPNLRSSLQNQSWQYLYTNDDINEITDSFLNILKEAIKINTDVKKINRRKTSRKPWISMELKNSINEKNDMYIKMKLNTDDIELQNKYRQYKNVLKKKFKFLKRNISIT